MSQRFDLDYHALKEALIDVAAPLLNAVELSDDFEMTVRAAEDFDEERVHKAARFLTAMIRSRYDIISESTLSDPLEEDPAENADLQVDQ
ncbi:hypothetical protein [Rhodopseudomonas parapalustris]